MKPTVYFLLMVLLINRSHGGPIEEYDEDELQKIVGGTTAEKGAGEKKVEDFGKNCNLQSVPILLSFQQS